MTRNSHADRIASRAGDVIAMPGGSASQKANHAPAAVTAAAHAHGTWGLWGAGVAGPRLVSRGPGRPLGKLFAGATGPGPQHAPPLGHPGPAPETERVCFAYQQGDREYAHGPRPRNTRHVRRRKGYHISCEDFCAVKIVGDANDELASAYLICRATHRDRQ